MDLRDKLSIVPDKPGVYQMFDRDERVIYVGKAKSLRQRLRSYFVRGNHESAKVRAMVENIADFEYILTDTEKEALVLESNLIKELRPHYNIRIKDDKHYPYLRLGLKEAYPRLTIVRRVESDGARYFGPYPNGSAVREMLQKIKRIFPLRQCNRDVAFGRPQGRPCLHFHLRQCLAPCQGNVEDHVYAAVVRQMEMLLDGRHESLLSEMRKSMRRAAERMNYEQAARIRDQIAAVEAVVEKQKIDAARVEERDVVGLAAGLEESCVALFRVREGKVVARESYFLSGTVDTSRGEILAAFLTQHYAARPVPGEILIPEELSEEQETVDFLRSHRQRRVRLVVPKRGEKKALLDLAGRNAAQVLEDKWKAAAGRKALLQKALEELAHELGLAHPPARIECYDISNISGTLSVGSMVVLRDGEPDRQAYRRFRIRWVEGSNDFASLHEVLTRRLAALTEGRKGFSDTPDLIIVDGGKGQLGAALDALRQEGYETIPLASLAKQEEDLFIPGRSEPVKLSPFSQARYLIERLRDEAHRFAITYHRQLRSKRGVASMLEECEGIGPARRKALLAAFGGLEKLRSATVAELAAVPGMNEKLARTLYLHLNGAER